MGPSFVHCTDRIYGFGDSTAGPIWKYSLKPEQPLLGGFQNSTNYPSGESMYSPVNYATFIQSVMIKTTSKIAGPVCGYNLVNIGGYLSTALVMFFFIKYLTRNRWVALLAGYAVSFTPYMQSKVGGHPSYGYGALLIAALWLTIHLAKHRKIVYAIMLAAVLGTCAYFDPYFILLAATVVAPIVGILVLIILWRLVRPKDTKTKQDSLELIKVFAVAFGIFMLFVGPLAYVRLKDANQINSTTSAVRGNVRATAMQCTNLPLDYILPDPRNLYLMSFFGNGYVARNIQHRHWCGFGESRVSISLTALTFIILGTIIFIWEKINKRKLRLGALLVYNPWFIISCLSLVGLAGFLLGLPPEVNGFITPSGVVLKITETWRIYAREYLVVNMIVITLFAVFLSYFASLYKKKYALTKIAMYVLVFMCIIFEYQINTPFKPLTFSYSQDIPSIYEQIKNTKNIDVIAEYPLDRSGIEYDSIVYYLTMQSYHHKKILNSAAINNGSEKVHIALKDLTDPQTIPALRYLGIKYITIHGSTEAEILAKTNQLQIIGHSNPPIYALTIVRLGGTNDMYLAKIIDGPKQENVLTIDKGFVVNLSIMKTPLNTEFETIQNAQLKIVALGKKTDTPVVSCFEAKMSAIGDTDSLGVQIGDTTTQVIHMTDQYQKITVTAKAGETITLHTTNGYNMRLNNLGCAQ